MPTTFRKVRELLGKHAGESAWIFGKGPSLDSCDVETTGPLRICINESLRCVSDPTYFFAHDEKPIQSVAKIWPADCHAILQQPRAEFAARQGIPAENMLVYEKRYGDGEILQWPAEKLAEKNYLYGNSGTIHSAIHFCRLIGATSVVLVGCDGSGGYAESLNLPPGGAQHERIRRDSINQLERLGLPYTFYEPRLA